MMAAPPSSYGERAPLQSYRRSFTLPSRSLSHHEKAGLDPSDSAADRLYSHPNVRIISFTPKTDAVPASKSLPLPDTDYPVDTIETLPWKSSMESTLAVAPMVIEKVRGSTNFLKCGVVNHAILRNSQCWCVDGESRFVLRIRRFQYYRIEMPNGTEQEKQKIEDLQVVLRKILRFEVTPCPFKRGFHVELSDSDLTPRRKGQWKRRESSLVSSPLSEIPQLRRTGRKWSMPAVERNSSFRQADADARADSGYGEGSSRRRGQFDDDYDDSEPHEDSSPERPSPLADRGNVQSHQRHQVDAEHLEDGSDDDYGVGQVKALSRDRGVPAEHAHQYESDDEAEEAEPNEPLPEQPAASVKDEVAEKASERTIEPENGEEPTPDLPHEDAEATQLHAASADESSHNVSEDPPVPVHTVKAEEIEEPTRDIPRQESESAQANTVTNDESSHIETLVSSDEPSEHVEEQPSNPDVMSETAKDLSKTADPLPEEAAKQSESTDVEPSPSLDTEDSREETQSVISSADSFHTLSPDDDFPIHENASSDYKYDRFRSPAPQGDIDSSLGVCNPRHWRYTSEATVREGSTTGAPTENSDIPSTPIRVRSSASDSSWPDVGTPASPDIQQGLRSRLRSRRSLSPLPPSATIYNPSQRHAQANHYTLALLQRCSVALVKPVEMVALLFHILARIAGGATVNDLLTGDLFKQPDEEPRDPRRHQSLPDQIDDRGDGGDTDEDDYGVPIRGRSKTTGPANRDVDADSLMDLD